MDASSLELIMTVVTTVVPILAVLCVGVGVFRVAFNSGRGYPYPSGGGSMIAGGLVLGGTSVLFPRMLDSLVDEASEKNPSPEPSMPDIDWSTVGWVVAGVAGAAALLALIYVTATKTRRSMARDAAEADRLDRIWKESVLRHDRLREEWLDVQQDVEKVLTFPLLSDVAEPKTAAFIEALGAAADLSSDRRPKSAESVERYVQATRVAETKWQAALHHAERVRLGRFEPGERDRIKKVQRLLCQAKNGGASPAERRAYYERARELLGDLIRLPEPARLALEQSVRGELEAPRPPSTWPGYSEHAMRVDGVMLGRAGARSPGDGRSTDRSEPE